MTDMKFSGSFPLLILLSGHDAVQCRITLPTNFLTLSPRRITDSALNVAVTCPYETSVNLYSVTSLPS